MGKQAKLALFVAPFLILGGYILSDIYLAEQAKDHVYALQVTEPCDVLGEGCVLQAGDLKLKLTDSGGKMLVNATLPLDRATLMLVAGDKQITTIPLAMQDNPYYWYRGTALRQLAGNPGESYRLRIVAEFQGASYIAEFVTRKQ